MDSSSNGPYPMADDVVVGEQLFGRRFSVYVTEITEAGNVNAEVRDFISAGGNRTPPPCTLAKSEDGERWWVTWSDGKKRNCMHKSPIYVVEHILINPIIYHFTSREVK